MKFMKTVFIYLNLLCITLLSTNCLAKDKPLVFNLTHTISDEPPSSIDRELVPNIEKLAKKALVRFGKIVQKKYAIRVIFNAPEKKYKFINGMIHINNIHAEYAHQKDYQAQVTLTALISIPDDQVVLEIKYSTRGKLVLSTQWAEWIGINKVTRFTLNRVLDKIIDDAKFSQALLSADKQMFFSTPSHNEPKNIQTDQPIETISIEERLKKLINLKEKGLVTEEEYKKKKKEILSEL